MLFGPFVLYHPLPNTQPEGKPLSLPLACFRITLCLLVYLSQEILWAYEGRDVYLIHLDVVSVQKRLLQNSRCL